MRKQNANFSQLFSATILPMKPILQHAIAVAGGRLQLASALGVHPSAITRWATAMPAKRELQLEKAYKRRKAHATWEPKK